MADRLRSALRWLGEQKKKHESAAVTYRCEDGFAIDLDATFGTREAEVADERNGNPLRIDYHDFVVDAADLVRGGTRFVPRRGEKIEFAIEGEVEVYEIASPTSSGEVWRYTDSTRRRIRIHSFLQRSEVDEESL